MVRRKLLSAFFCLETSVLNVPRQSSCFQCLKFSRPLIQSSWVGKSKVDEETTRSAIATHSLLNSIVGNADPLILDRWKSFKPNLPQVFIFRLENVLNVSFVRKHSDISCVLLGWVPPLSMFETKMKMN